MMTPATVAAVSRIMTENMIMTVFLFNKSFIILIIPEAGSFEFIDEP